MFTGDQLGALFAGRVLEEYKASGKPLGRFSLKRDNKYPLQLQHGADNLSMVASTVSSKMIEAMAAAEGFKFTECLTGSY